MSKHSELIERLTKLEAFLSGGGIPPRHKVTSALTEAAEAIQSLMVDKGRFRSGLYEIIGLDHHNMGPESRATTLARTLLGDSQP